MQYRKFQKIRRLLVANRGEIAVRIMRTARDLGVASVAVYSMDDTASLHRYQGDVAVALSGSGASAYLDIDALLTAAAEHGCDAVHPGYGFLSESAEFARRCEDVGLTFVGPTPAQLALFGNKLRARAMARDAGVRVLPGTNGPTSLEEALTFFESCQPMGMLIKAVAGGGGRGMRVVTRHEELHDAFARCQSEASAAFGNGALYVEQRMTQARHVEVQVLGDGTGAVTHLGERDCSIQRRHQKLLEITPAPFLPEDLRRRITEAAVALAAAAHYRNAGTFEFLVDTQKLGGGSAFAFIEANPRLQVEHTVTEEVFGIDLVAVQLALASGGRLDALGLLPDRLPEPRGTAIQLRVNLERMQADGTALPATGSLTAFAPPLGPGVRVDTFGYAGFVAAAGFDSLLAKVIVRGDDFDHAVARASRALEEFHIDGVSTNLGFLRNLLVQDDFRSGRLSTGFIAEHLPALTATEPQVSRRLPPTAPVGATALPRADLGDWASVLSYGRLSRTDLVGGGEPSGLVAAPMPGRILAVDVTTGERVAAGRRLMVMESMKMEYDIMAPRHGVVHKLAVSAGDVVSERQMLLVLAAQPDSVAEAPDGVLA